MFQRKSYNRDSPSSRSKPSSTPVQQRREPPRQPQAKHTPAHNSSRPSETKVVVLSDSDDDPPPKKAPPPDKKAGTPLVIEIEDDSDDDRSPNQTREKRRLNPFTGLPVTDPSSSTQRVTPSLPLQRRDPKASAQPPRPPVWDPNDADYGPPATFRHGSSTRIVSTRAERPIRVPNTQPPGFWNTKGPQSEGLRAGTSRGQPNSPQLQTSAVSQAERTQARVSRESPLHKAQSGRSLLQKGQPASSVGMIKGPSPLTSSTGSPSTNTTSSFPTAFKHYSSSVRQHDRPPASPKEGFASFTTTVNKPPVAASPSVCNNCALGRFQCDGAKPTCNQCTARGVACAYDAETTPSPRSKLLVRLKVPSSIEIPPLGRSKAMHPGHESTSMSSPQGQLAGHDHTGIDAPNNLPAKKTKIVLRAPHLPASAPNDQVAVTDQNVQNGSIHDQLPEAADTESSISADYQQIDHASLSSDISPHPGRLVEMDSTLETCTNLLEDLRKELHGWQESSTQAELRQATADAKRRPGPKLDQTLSDPFKAVTVDRRATGGSQQERPKNKKLFTIRAVPTSFPTGAGMLPKYQAIGRVSSSVLAPNYKTAKYWAYSAEDEDDPDSTRKYKDFENHYNIDFAGLIAQRQCQELVWLWKPWVEEAFSRLRIRSTDLLYFFTFSLFGVTRSITFGPDQLAACQNCGLGDAESRGKFFNSDAFNALPHPDDRSLAAAAFLAHAFHAMTGISLWHVAAGGLLQPRYRDKPEKNTQESNLCLICFRHCCPDHGSYEDPGEESDAKPLVNDSEQDSNIRKFVSLPDVQRRDDKKTHQCGAFCVQPSLSLRQILGRQSNGTIDGDARLPKAKVRSVLADDQLCSESCFWDVGNRRDIHASEVKFQPFLSASMKIMVEKLIPFYLSNPRGPCLISRVIKDVDCLMVFNHMIFAIFDPPHPDDTSGAMSDSSTGQRGSFQAGKKRRVIPVIDTTRSADLAILDSSNKYKDEIRIGRCRNNRIQLGLPAPTTKAPSQVQGYGLYSRAEIRMGDFIGEYTGDIISRSEGNRRGTIYHLVNQEYLFNLNQNQEIDASKNGNKMRFMNNSQREENINVEAKSLFCGGVVRIGLFAKRDITAGVELLWKYGYSAELVKYFWEPGEKPATARALIPYSNERLARNTGRNKLAGESSRTGRAASSQSPAVNRGMKRKRGLFESPGQVQDKTFEDTSEEEAVEDLVADLPKPPEIDDSEDSDYHEPNGHVSEDAEVDDDDLDEDSDLEHPQDSRGRTSGASGTPKKGRRNLPNGASSSSRSVGGSTSQQRKQTVAKGMKKNSREASDYRRRQIKPGDKRIGGKAQQRAWETRKQNSLGGQVMSSPG
ncbi:hypothetical protein H2200_010567 [Cladophialophora chaetospira]|uniref:SET domain-containing protein n=1 Tax=Cladophialophora chaetospira TaxID=386627 RepID=A0AA38X1X2_9EURO|nr:hypothetical protein H2200_010567 [Cladophialophora chaetospira]